MYEVLAENIEAFIPSFGLLLLSSYPLPFLPLFTFWLPSFISFWTLRLIVSFVHPICASRCSFLLFPNELASLSRKVPPKGKLNLWVKNFDIPQEEEEKERRKNERFKEVNKRRKLELLQKDAQKRAKEFEKKVFILNLFVYIYLLKWFGSSMTWIMRRDKHLLNL